MRSLVIGAAGFVGQYLIKHLAEQGDEVMGASMTGDVPGLQGRSFKLEITDAHECANVLREAKPDVVYHLAAIAFVPEAEADFDRTLSINVGGVSNVIRTMHLMGGESRLVFISSAEVYGAVSAEELPIVETTPCRPSNNYSLSKRMAELVVERYSRQGPVRTAIARPFNHIGPGQDDRFVASNFALQLARIAHGLSAPVLTVGNLAAKRDFSDVRDIVRAYRLLGASSGGLYNLGSGQSRSIQSLLDTLIRISGLRVEVRTDPARMRGPEVPELYGSCAKIERELGWSRSISFEQSLTDIYQFWHRKLSVERAV